MLSLIYGCGFDFISCTNKLQYYFLPMMDVGAMLTVTYAYVCPWLCCLVINFMHMINHCMVHDIKEKGYRCM